MKTNKKILIGIGIILPLILSFGFLIVHIIGVYSEASKYAYPTENTANKEIAKVISIANQTQEVKTFMQLYPNATVDVGLQAMCCPEDARGAREFGCLCFPIALSQDAFNWLVEYRPIYHDNSTWFEPSVRVVIGRNGEILGIFCDLYGDCEKYK